MVVQIPLTGRRGRGLVALVDDLDADLAGDKWNYIKGYAAQRPAHTTISMHRIILSRMLGRPLSRTELADHIDRNPLNNCRSNLRLVTYEQNAQNSEMRKINSSGFKGISFAKKHGKWQAKLRVEYRDIHLGFFDIPEDAARAYDAAAHHYFGEYAGHLNFPDEITEFHPPTPGVYSHNTSGYRGVVYERRRQKWIAQIKVNRKQIYLGQFSTPEEAARAYDAAAKRLHGPHAFLNFPDE